MIIKAKYEDKEQPCYINTDFVVDVFEHGDEYIAYTFDPDRMGYIISKEDFEKWQKYANEDEQKICYCYSLPKMSEPLYRE